MGQRVDGRLGRAGHREPADCDLLSRRRHVRQRPVTTADGKTGQATASKFAREDGDVVLLYINNNHYEIVK